MEVSNESVRGRGEKGREEGRKSPHGEETPSSAVSGRPLRMVSLLPTEAMRQGRPMGAGSKDNEQLPLSQKGLDMPEATSEAKEHLPLFWW